MLDFRSWCRPRPLAGRCIAAPAALSLALFFWAAIGVGQAQAPEDGCDAGAAANVQVTVEKVRSSEGLITAVLYADNPETFLKKGGRLDRIRVDAREGETTLCLQAPAAGRYSVALYHDENGNKEFDQDFLGIPSEGYGFSKNPGFRFGVPEQEETLFTIEDAPVSLRIAMLYLH